MVPFSIWRVYKRLLGLSKYPCGVFHCFMTLKIYICKFRTEKAVQKLGQSTTKKNHRKVLQVCLCCKKKQTPRNVIYEYRWRSLRGVGNQKYYHYLNFRWMIHIWKWFMLLLRFAEFGLGVVFMVLLSFLVILQLPKMKWFAWP